MDLSRDRSLQDQSVEYSELWLKSKILAGEFYLDEVLADLENRCISLAMDIYQGKLSQVARALHINRTTLYSRMNKTSDKGK